MAYYLRNLFVVSSVKQYNIYNDLQSIEKEIPMAIPKYDEMYSEFLQVLLDLSLIHI